MDIRNGKVAGQTSLVGIHAGACSTPAGGLFKENSMKCTFILRPPKLVVDIPSEDWLKQKQRVAKTKSEGGRYYIGAVTAYYEKPITVPMSVLSKIKGSNQEQENPRAETLKFLKEKMANIFLQNDKEGIYSPPYIEVAYDGTAFIAEGNHRIMAAHDLGWKEMPVDIRYFDGGERAQGVLAPDVLSSFFKDQGERNEICAVALG